MLCNATGVVWLFVMVTAFVTLVVPTLWVANASEAGAIPTGTIPLPDRFTTRGLRPASTPIDILPARLPLAVGVKTALTLQVAPAANCAGSVPQVLVWA